MLLGLTILCFGLLAACTNKDAPPLKESADELAQSSRSDDGSVVEVSDSGRDVRGQPIAISPEYASLSEDGGWGRSAPVGSNGYDIVSSRPLEEAEIYRGTGKLIGSAVGSADAAAAVGSLGGGSVTLNFVDADVKEVVAVILGETLGVSYVIDPAVSGSVTARTAEPLNRSQVLGTLESILAIVGAALVPEDDVWTVRPLEQAEGQLAPAVATMVGARMPRGYALHVFPVEYVSSTALAESLQGFIAPGRQLVADPGRNILMFTGPGVEASDLLTLVRTFDVDWMAGMSFGLFPLDVAEPEQVVEELSAIFQQQADDRGGILEFIPIERMGAVLVIAKNEQYLKRAQQWVERLDRGERVDQPQIYVYYVQNGRATDLASVLREMFDATGSTPNLPTDGGVSPGLSSVQLSSRDPSGTAGTDTQQQANAADGGDAVSRDTGALPDFRLTRDGASGYGAAGVGLSGGLGAQQADAEIKVIADAVNNALIFRAKPEEYRMIESALRKLDVAPLQVLLEATIAEVQLQDQLRYGLQWFFNFGDFSAVFARTAATTLVAAPAAALPGFALTFENSDARVILDALSEITNVNVVSSPQLVVRDNQPARLNVGDQVPVPTRSSVSVTDPDAPSVNEIEYRDTGVILEILPRISSSGLVSLDIIQEVSDVQETTSSDIDAPTISRRTIQSTVAVQNGDTLVLGGLIRDREEDTVSGVPLLKDIPVLGEAFKSTDRISARTELLVLLTPRVIGNRRQARELTDEVRRRFKKVEELRARELPLLEERRFAPDESGDSGLADPHRDTPDAED
jgi:general secretion pathway protein D